MADAVLSVELPGLKRLGSGKVGEIFEIEDRLVIIRTDRVSAFDVVMRQGIPGRGVVLTKLSEFWFRRLEDICANHLVTCDVDAMPDAVRRKADTCRGRSTAGTSPAPAGRSTSSGARCAASRSRRG